MKTYEITIKPLSGFGTPLKGDTIFGHICWQAAYNDGLFSSSIEALLADYSTNPFLIVSSAHPVSYKGTKSIHILKRPDLPLDNLFDFSGMGKKSINAERKKLKAKKWMPVEKSQRFVSFKAINYINDKELFEIVRDSVTVDLLKDARKKGVKSFMADYTQPHNAINRLTGTTGEGGFAPFTVDQKVYFPQSELSIFVGIRDGITLKQVENALSRIGEIGFGKDASTGLGKFEVCDVDEIDLNSFGSSEPNACYALSPCVPEKDVFRRSFFSPFIRFGRHGDILAKSKNPFKNPVIMADEGAIFIPKEKDVFIKPYIGTAVTDISLAEEHKAVMQGYSLYIPVRVEV